ncbi:hypothetical protein GQ43DRAFT_364277 [Delitschia confertaspora ATCC 74209]|uniref:Uncharacterized protein n=1 Tax=Delitschia confertaspora ATCC 74209 TaxID=1513339 RepID=A0A9P4JW74_9PLEO|nr:hypothetical protein GQ43DRAFT_364277 [Delitschia confertaspora ATCC 74209]
MTEMATTRVFGDRALVSAIFHELSDMKFKIRQQPGPHLPVEFLEFKPTLIPYILVNHLWADEGTSILWANHPNLAALANMTRQRKQYYANKVQKIFLSSPQIGHSANFHHLRGLSWPLLRSLALSVDFARHFDDILGLLLSQVECLRISGIQSKGSQHFQDSVLPELFSRCPNLKSIRLEVLFPDDQDSFNVNSLVPYLSPKLKQLEIASPQFVEREDFFRYLCKKPGLESLEINLPPGLGLMPTVDLQSTYFPKSFFFQSLKELTLTAYPEIASALLFRLESLVVLKLLISRIPEQAAEDSDFEILEDLLVQRCHTPQLRQLEIALDTVATNFPSQTSLPLVTGAGLIQLATACPNLTNLILFVTGPSGINGSRISSQEFNLFCRKLPALKELSLKFNPITVSALQSSALHSLGKYCPKIEVLRLKMTCDLTSLPIPNTIPLGLVEGRLTTERHLRVGHPNITNSDHFDQEDGHSTSRPSQSTSQDTSSDAHHERRPLFPCLTKLAIARPYTFLAPAEEVAFWPTDVEDDVSTPTQAAPQRCLDPPPINRDTELDETLVRSYAHPLLIHFPSIEVLEAWGDWAGADQESLKYFLPLEGLLETIWDFLSGIEQDVWEDEEERGEEDGWMMDEEDEWTMDEEGNPCFWISPAGN